MADWSTLHIDILGEILGKIDDWEEFAYFSVVCHWWYQAYSIFKYTRRPPSPKICLLLAENTRENPDCRRKILDVNNNKCYQLKLPQTFGARCWGSACGWIVTLDLDRQLYMLNPFTKDRIRLPPQPTMPHNGPPLEDPYEDACSIRKVFIQKATVLKDEGGNFVVLALVGFWRRLLAFARPGDQSWTSVDPPWTLHKPVTQTSQVSFKRRVADIACCGARAIILYVDGSLGYLDISDINTSSKQQPVKAKMFLRGPPKGLDQSHFDPPNLTTYLVESFGQLLMTIRVKEDRFDKNIPEKYNEDRSYATIGFGVYRLNLNTKVWERLNNLGNIALYVGVSHSVSVRSSGSGNCKSNCIYFTDDYTERWGISNFGGFDMGVFDLESQKVDSIYGGDNHLYSSFCPPLWFVPQF